MVTRFGSREICDVTFKALTNGQRVGNKEFKAGQPVFVIDTATASNMEQASTTVYAQGGRGYNRLIAWEGEKTMTFTVTDALMSPLGLAVLTGAGFAAEDAVKHVHMTYDLALDANGAANITIEDFARELGVSKNDTVKVCDDQPDENGHVLRPYATVLDGNGAIVDWVDADDITFSGTADTGIENAYAVSTNKPLTVTVANGAGKTIKLDFYVYMTTGATEITIKPDDFGGNFYVEADTLYRNQDGKDMAATLTFPKVKIQSGFTLSMAPTGDPSTFDFVMDAMPGYTYFDRANKVVCDITIVSGAADASTGAQHSVPTDHNAIPATGVTPKAGTSTIFDYDVADLQSDIAIANKAITGTLKEVTTGSLPVAWPGYTHFLALDFALEEGVEPTDVKVGINSLAALDADKDAALAIDAESLTKGLKVVTTKNGKEYTKIYDLSGLTLA